MSDIVEIIDPDAHVDYFWPPLEPELIPSAKMTELVGTYSSYGPFDIFSSLLWGRQGTTEWPTKSIVEVGFASGSRSGLIVWSSGFPADPDLELPSQATAGYLECDSPEQVLQKHQAKLETDGKLPIIGVTACFDGSGWHPVILGYESISG